MLAYAAKSVKDDSGHLHDEGNGQFTSGGDTPGQGKLKPKESGEKKPASQGEATPPKEAEKKPSTPHEEWEARYEKREADKESLGDVLEVLSSTQGYVITDKEKAAWDGLVQLRGEFIGGDADLASFTQALDGVSAVLGEKYQEVRSDLVSAGIQESKIAALDKVNEKMSAKLSGLVEKIKKDAAVYSEAETRMSELEESEPDLNADLPEEETPEEPEEPTEPDEPVFQEAQLPPEPEGPEGYDESDPEDVKRYEEEYAEWEKEHADWEKKVAEINAKVDAENESLAAEYDAALDQWQEDHEEWEAAHEAWDDEMEVLQEKHAAKMEKEHARWEKEYRKAEETVGKYDDLLEGKIDDFADASSEYDGMLHDKISPWVDSALERLDKEDETDEEPDEEETPMTKSLSVIPLLRNKPGLLGRVKSHDKHRAKRRGMEVSQAAQTLGRLGGKIGGPARARKLSAARRSEIAKQGGRARQGKSLGTLSF